MDLSMNLKEKSPISGSYRRFDRTSSPSSFDDGVSVRVTELLTPDCGVTVLVQPINQSVGSSNPSHGSRNRIKQELLILVVGCDPQVRRTNS